MPDGSRRSKPPTSFNTIEREKSFRSPPKDGSTYNILNEFVTPHIESFNALFDDSGLPAGDGDGRGLLSLALKDIGERVVFDGNGRADSESGPQGWGNRMRGKYCRRVYRLNANTSISVDRSSHYCQTYGSRQRQNRNRTQSLSCRGKPIFMERRSLHISLVIVSS